MKKYWIPAVFAAVLLAAQPLMADEHMKGGDGHQGKKMEKIMEKTDTDGDGVISRAEFDAANDERFSRTDADGDGVLSSEEMKAAWEKMREKRQDKRKKMKEASESDGADPEGGDTDEVVPE